MQREMRSWERMRRERSDLSRVKSYLLACLLCPLGAARRLLLEIRKKITEAILERDSCVRVTCAVLLPFLVL